MSRSEELLIARVEGTCKRQILVYMYVMQLQIKIVRQLYIAFKSYIRVDRHHCNIITLLYDKQVIY